MTLAHQSAGHEVEIASLDEPGDTLVSLPFTPHLLGPARGNYGRADKFIPWLKQNHQRFDGVIVNGLWQYQGYASRKVLHGTRTPYFVFPHGMLDPWFKQKYPLKHWKKWTYWPWGEYRVIRDAAATLFTCEEEKLLAPQSFWLYRAHSVVTGMGTMAPEVDLAEAKQQFLQAHPELLGKRIVLFIGRIHPKKGCDLLIQAFAKIFSSSHDWRLLMVGPDQLGWQGELEQMAGTLGIANRITWAGPRMGSGKWGPIAAAEVFALPSHQENFGIAVAEALACGKPVLISNKVNIWREIQQDRAGLVGTDTIDGTADLLREWASLPETDREAFTLRAQACFRKHFDIRVCAAAVVEAVRAAQAASGQSRA
jgi:glycosyltransferase involved in cell wall biosynthesis